ncbi:MULTISPECIES: carboxypeptidase-like regulatory domain-containing protein [Flavobacterium]|uniref:Carboxypeptidase-like regulatory domain-containing protein n=1 Tax=Flavobacterium keumense TaxID=1306518 RepID=A0ABY8N5B9_9FLAO|nr:MULTISPECIES: carboxypeptidase-like regulatory domain-containing protein [Flavobacterium]WGK94839.1 carboxypeptidase-like regulatory domain-containing protein [Flavobacterium keumense]
MIRLICFIVFWCTAQLFAQGNVPVECHGKVNADMTNLEGIYVINLKTENASITDREGYFFIKAAVGDTLLLSAYQFKSVKIALTPEHLQTNVFFVEMKPIMNELKEVVVSRYPNISAEALGIIPNGIKKYTPAERKLATASSGFGLDPLLNLMSGRTNMLKKELEVEKKETFLAQLESMFDQNHLVNTLHIPTIYVKGFLYFAVENPKFTRVLETKNHTSIEFLLAELARQYLEIVVPKKEN